MQDRRSVTEIVKGKCWSFSQTFKLMFICHIKLCILFSSLRLVVASELFKGLDQNPVNPGIGVNYYGKIQKTTPKTLGNGLTFDGIFKDFVPRNCSNAPKGTSCIQRDYFFQDPDFLYQVSNPVPCDFNDPYRNYDGTCISPHIPILGMANDCYFRFTTPFYDGFGDFRKSVNGNPLPEPRDISLKIFKDRHRREVDVSFQFLTFGQLIAHDVSRAVQPQTDCCLPENAKKEECAPISVRPDDPFYSRFKIKCINFQRSEKCELGKIENREQKNGVTAAIDGSFIYGVTEDRVNRLRALDGTGMLTSVDTKNSECLLPTGKDPEDIFCPKKQESECFISGDYRVNQHASLTSLHTAWMREHNRLAKELKLMNPHWDDDKLFHEARKIVIAEFQCIIYQDFLPILVTPRIMDEFDMTIKKGSEGTLFNPLAVVAVWHEFAHAAFRLHNMVPTDIGALNLEFKDTFSNPDLIQKGHTSDLIKGSQYVPIEKYDRYMIDDFTDYLYRIPGVPYGQDLVSTNIQRGRDHGMAPYVDIVRFCSELTINITSFNDLVRFKLMPGKYVKLLKQIYESVEDVDMWVGMQLENHMSGSFLGPSAICVIAKQFHFSQRGDRLFFNHEGLMEPFTADQRSTLKNISLSRIMCDNIDVEKIPRNSFLLPSSRNPVVSCEKIPKIDLSLWKENEPTD